MEKSKIIQSLRKLSLENTKDLDYPLFLETGINDVYEKLEITHESITRNISYVVNLNFSKNVNLEWNYVCLGLFLLKSLSEEAENSAEVFLSVQETKDVKKFIRNLVTVGICTKLQPNLPFKMKSDYFASEDIFWEYNVLKCTTFGLTEFLKIPFLRFVILPDNLKEILVALYQICYCPLKKPNPMDKNGITNEIYQQLLKERQTFFDILNYLKRNIHPHIFVKETMLCMHKNSPVWFKKQISQDLTMFLQSKDGVKTVALSLFGDHEINTKNWEILDIFSKLILNCSKFPDFKENICKQLLDLLHAESTEKSLIETIWAHCTKKFYPRNPEMCKSIFIKEIIAPFLYFTYKSHKFSNYDVTADVKLTAKLLHAVFIETTSEEIVIPVDIIQPIVNVIFKFYVVTQSLKTVHNDLGDLLLLFIEQSHQEKYFDIFDTLLFDFQSKEILPIRNDVIITTDQNNVKIKMSEQSVKYSTSESCEVLCNLLKSKPKLLVLFFGYLLNCITNEEKYFKKSNQELLEVEEYAETAFIERKIVVYKLLAELAAEKYVREELNKNPVSIVEYMKKTFDKRKTLMRCESIFTVLMILDNLLYNCSKDNRKHFNILLEPLKNIHEETNDEETKCLVNSILESLMSNEIEKLKVAESELDKAVEDICDPLLPTRGHGLLTLTKLIEKKDKEVMERKQFVLNILQQNITNKDSFIYLNAINGLAAMADVFPDTILNLLCDEYSDTSRKDTIDYSEVRMKLGEVLVKVTKILSEMAPKYKSLLLNTFLIGAKDDDDLIRSSSLSNLGEICRVLGYKLGSLFTEVLVCVHAIIATDKSPQARRAAVTVIRQLFAGLEQDIIEFFKEDILPVYRTLKQIYNNDKDDIMRLQAQLALEELNENMKNFVFPKPQLNIDKKIVLLN